MKELYRNFEKLGIERQWGYIIYDDGDNFLIEYVSVYDEEEAKILLPKRFLLDGEFSEEATINQFWIMVNHGDIMDAKVFYKGKWYSGERYLENSAREQELPLEDVCLTLCKKCV